MRLDNYLSKDNNRAIKFIEMTLRPDFERAINELRRKHQINLEDTEEAESKRMYLLEMEDSEIASDVEKILSQLGINQSWKDIVYQYLIDDSGYSYNNKDPYITINSNGLRISVNTENTDDIILYVGPETTYRDYRNAWNEIKKNRKNIPVRKKERNNFLRDYYIYTLVKENKSITEICNIVEKDFKIDISYGNIKKIFTTFCNHLKIPKKDRPKLRTE